MSEPDTVAVCPVVHARSLPVDGSPLRPSARLAQWRSEADLSSLVFADGHVGLIATGYDVGQQLLSDPRFIRRPIDRFPMPSAGGPVEIDADAAAALAAGSILNHDGDSHQRLRRALTARFSVKAARAHRGDIAAIVSEEIGRFAAMSRPVDLTRGFADRVSARTHCLVLGIPASHVDEYMRLFVEHGEETPLQAKFDFLREVLRLKRQSPAEDSLSDLVTSDLDPAEVEGLTFTLMVSGRDSVAYMIATSMVALLSNPDQFESLRDNPEMIDGATEEFLRAGAMFVTLFPRTAAEDVVVDGMLIPEGTTVAVSPVAVNHDARRFPDPESFDISRDAYGHFGFGFGIHGCVGQQVARVEIKESVTQLIGALPTLRLIHADQADALPFAHEVGTYQAGRVLVDWS